MKRIKNFLSTFTKWRSWRHQCIQTQAALRDLYHATEQYEQYQHLSTRLELARAKDKAGRWF